MSKEQIMEAIEKMTVLELSELVKALEESAKKLSLDIDGHNLSLLEGFESKKKKYTDEFYIFKVRNKELKIKTHYVGFINIRLTSYLSI